MAFENLSNRITKAFKHIAGKDRLSDRNIEAMLSEIRVALLEADVNYKVVKDFCDQVKQRMIGIKVSEALNPDQMVYKLVSDEIVALLGSELTEINYQQQGLTIIMVVGLQGTGKTTNIAKVAKLIKEKKARKPLLVAADLIRPAAIEQLKTLGQQADIEVFSLGEKTNAVDTVSKAIDYAYKNSFDTVLIDTAGRLHIDSELMKELETLKKKFKPHEILLTVDALAGQDIANVAKKFNDLLNVTGLIVTKFDGDSRGGGILSVKAIANVPIKFVGTGEKLDDIDYFYPDRTASRILGMGDLASLIEKAEKEFDEEAARLAAERMADGTFTLDDMLVQLKQVKKLGSFSNILGMLPGMGDLQGMIKDVDTDGIMKRYEAIIQSMTKYERAHPDELRSSHKNRISKGCGVPVTEINKMLNSYERTKKMMGSFGLGRFKKF